MLRSRWRRMAASEAPTSPGTPNAENIATLTNVSGSTVTSYPLRIGRVFAEGEIADSPQLLVDGTPATTGADVKTRWSDGSVQHAIMHTVVSSMTNNVAKEITFQNQAESNTALTKSEMLDSRFDFDAVIAYTVGGVTRSASARTMLNADKYTVWCANQVATTVVIADHSTARAYDMGWDTGSPQHYPFRPTFIATFWNALNKVEVAAIGECANAEELADITGNLAIYSGTGSPTTTVYTKTSLTTYVGTRWIVRFWIGTAPTTVVNLDHNLAYLASTYAWPNYDTSITVSGTALTDMYSTWTSSSKDLYDDSNWEPHMGNAGTRAEIGPMPTWTVLWLYSGDYRMREVALGTADRAGAWPLHFRETATGKRLQRADSAGNSGLGRPISITDRPTICLALESLYNYGNTTTADKIKVVGTWATSSVHEWTPKDTHQPDPFYTQYMLTGDPFYLEQMQFWTSAFATFTDGAATGQGYGRGPTGAEGGVEEEPRGHAWMLRNRSNCSFASPDSDPFKDYLKTLIEDAAAVQEGKWGVTTGDYNGTTLWTWAQSHTQYPSPNALAFTDLGGSSKQWGQSPFMTYYNIFAMGRAVEMGFVVGGLLEWASRNLIGILTSPDMNPWECADYQMPAGPDAGGSPYNTSYFQVWADVFAADDIDLGAGIQNENDSLSQTSIAAPNSDHPYEFVAACATAYVTSFTNGAAARAWIETNVYDPMNGKDYTPKWCIIPRT